MQTLLMIGTTEIIIIALVVLLLFGGSKIPELMKGLGKGMRSFKDAVDGKDESSHPTAPDADKKDDNPAPESK